MGKRYIPTSVDDAMGRAGKSADRVFAILREADLDIRSMSIVANPDDKFVYLDIRVPLTEERE